MTTAERRAEVLRLRALGWSLLRIAKEMGMTRQGIHYYTKPPTPDTKPCRRCGKMFPRVVGKNAILFCTEGCRRAWNTGKSYNRKKGVLTSGK